VAGAVTVRTPAGAGGKPGPPQYLIRETPLSQHDPFPCAGDSEARDPVPASGKLARPTRDRIEPRSVQPEGPEDLGQPFARFRADRLPSPRERIRVTALTVPPRIPGQVMAGVRDHAYALQCRSRIASDLGPVGDGADVDQTTGKHAVLSALTLAASPGPGHASILPLSHGRGTAEST
jgi:hypothetical protein